jgi:predicted Zn-dependent protease with MMP-like domain
VDPVPVDRFEQLVADALDDIPDELARLIDNVVVLVEDEAPEDPDLLGVYEGVPHTERADYGIGFTMPDRIVIYRLPLCGMCETEDEVVEEVAVTVVHELAHHFGIDDDELDRLGWA